MSIREASHAGSWYESDRNVLNNQLAAWLDKGHHQSKQNGTGGGGARAIIAPHAGYSYCGAVAGVAYSQIIPANIRRVFILGPSHHVHINGIALSNCRVFRTPLRDLHLDEQVYQRLRASTVVPFDSINVEDDEAEHSLEMHMPFVAKVFEKHADSIRVVPLVVGHFANGTEQRYAELLLPYFLDPTNLFIISSDFCHWGRRFHYTPYDKDAGDIFQSIERLDRKAMEIIELMDPSMFRDYLNKTENTICGRNPITVLLNLLKLSGTGKQSSPFTLKFLRYAQSSQCRSMHDSSVSYAAAVVVAAGDNTANNNSASTSSSNNGFHASGNNNHHFTR